MVFLEEDRADSSPLPRAFRGRVNHVLSILGQFQHHVRSFSTNCPEQVWKTQTHLLHPWDPQTKRKEKIGSMCTCWHLCTNTALSSVTSIFPRAIVCLFSLHWIKSRVKKQNAKRNIHSPFLERDLHLHCHVGPKSDRREGQTFKLRCLLINESTAQSEKLSQSPCKAPVWLKGAEEQEAWSNFGPPTWQQSPHRCAGQALAGWARAHHPEIRHQWWNWVFHNWQNRTLFFWGGRGKYVCGGSKHWDHLTSWLPLTPLVFGDWL